MGCVLESIASTAIACSGVQSMVSDSVVIFATPSMIARIAEIYDACQTVTEGASCYDVEMLINASHSGRLMDCNSLLCEEKPTMRLSVKVAVVQGSCSGARVDQIANPVTAQVEVHGYE